MANIRVMKEVLANKIAAGEVIERPLSVVKELVENAIDANCTQIEINLLESGLKQIIVKDNGNGMDEEDLTLSIKRHATSKLYDDKDLFKISTLGFRGEALPSIFAVSNLKISTSTDGITGFSLSKVSDEEFEIEKIGMNKGTIIEINNLFYNTPVRFKHLSNPFYELSLTLNFINKLSLLHPNISFVVNNDGNNLINTNGNGDIRGIFAKQYSVELAKRLMIIKKENSHFKIELFTSHPHDTRSRKNYITIGLNQRLIRNYEIENKIISSYGTFLHTGQYPICFINIEVNYALIDVNIHPTKQQVKISLIDSLLDLIETSIKEELTKLTYIGTPTNIKVDDYKTQASDEQVNKTIDKMFMNYNETKPKSFNEPNIRVNPKLSEQQFDDDLFKYNSTNVNYSSQLFDIDSKVSQKSLQKLPMLEFVGTMHNTYLVFENGDGLFLIDQHAAQERINYELILDMFNGREFSFQQTLLPLIITLNEIEDAKFSRVYEKTTDFGFKVESFGLHTYRVVEVDSWLGKRKTVEDDINEIVRLMIDKTQTNYQDFIDEIAINMACKKSIKAHQRVSPEEAIDLIKQLNKANQPFTCPHGRPILVKITISEIEKMFKRVF